VVAAIAARDVHLAMGPGHRDSRVRFRVWIDDRPPGPAHGVDADERGAGTVIEQPLYQPIRQPGPIVARTVVIELLDAGVEAFAFTSG
jgi:Thioredoxin like C-terminal domain